MVMQCVLNSCIEKVAFPSTLLPVFCFSFLRSQLSLYILHLVSPEVSCFTFAQLS